MHPLYFHRQPPIIVLSKQKSIKEFVFLFDEPNFMNFRPRLSHKWVLYGWASLIILLLFHAVVGERGAIHLWRLQGEKVKLDEQNYRLQKDNEALREKISRLRTDNFYLEKIAREELNLAHPGEIIYRFRSSQPEGNKSRVPSVPASESHPSGAQKSRR
jgi:cell division protein FtsB